MPMVLVVDMRMFVFHRHVRMEVLVVLGQVQPYADSHQHASHEKGHGERRSQYYGKRSAQKRRH